MPETETLIAHIDGASRGNPGPAAYAVVVKDAHGAIVASLTKTLGKTTNNFAEYQALLAALEYAIEHGRRRVKIFSDSELLVRQIEGRYRVKNEGLKPLHEHAMVLIRELESFSIAHVPRERNQEADTLANQALDGAPNNTIHHQDTKSQSQPTQTPQEGQDHNQDDSSLAFRDCIPRESSQEPLPPRVNELAKTAVDAVYRVHSGLGPGLLESVYEVCLAHELRKRGLVVEQQVAIPIVYDDIRLESGLRLDLLVEQALIIELKSVEALLPIHRAQMLTYLKLTGRRLGLLINFNVPLIRDGIKRVVL